MQQWRSEAIFTMDGTSKNSPDRGDELRCPFLFRNEARRKGSRDVLRHGVLLKDEDRETATRFLAKVMDSSSANLESVESNFFHRWSGSPISVPLSNIQTHEVTIGQPSSNTGDIKQKSVINITKH
jgi:hypothetical protein